MKTKILLVAIILLSCFSVYAQKTGHVCFRIFPTPKEIKINGEVIPIGKTTECRELPVGTHLIQIWSPKYELVTDSFTVIADRWTRYGKDLTIPSPAYEAYKKELTTFHNERRGTGSKIFGLLVTNSLLTAYTGIYVPLRMNAIKSKAKIIRTDYYAAIHENQINNLKTEYEKKQRVYNRHRILLYTGITLTVSSYIATLIYHKTKKDKSKKPIFNPVSPLANFDVKIENSNYLGRPEYGFVYTF